MYLAIDQYGDKTILADVKRKTIKEKFYAGRIQKMYRDAKEGQARHVGYVLGQGHGNTPLWIELFRLEPLTPKG